MVSRKLRLKRNAKMIFAVLILLVLSLGALVYLSPDEQVKKSSFDLPDVCGIVSGNMFHSIPDDNQCRVQCLNKCRSFDLDFKSSEFDIQTSSSCYSCKCNCE